MKLVRLSFLTIAVFLLATPFAHALNTAHLSSRGYGGASSDAGFSVGADAAGNIYVAGSFQGTANFGGSNLVSAGNSDIFLAKYYPNGTHQWSQRFGSTGNDYVYSLAVSATGDVYVTGSFNGTVDFGGGDLVSAGGSDIVVAKYNTSGFQVWSQRFGSTSNDEGQAVAVDGVGNVFVTGDFGGTVNFGGGNLVSAGLANIFLAKYATNGTHQWSQRFGSTTFDLGRSLALDGAGNLCVTGSFIGAVNFGGGNLVSNGTDIFIAKYHPMAGLHLWSQRFGGSGIDEGFGVAGDASGNVIATGYFNGTVDFGGGNLVSTGANEIFLAKYNTMGAHQWSRRFGGTSADIGRSVAVDGSGNVFTAGQFQGTTDFGNGNVTSAGNYDIYIAKFDATGAHLWSQRFGSTGADAGYSLVLNNGRVMTTGTFSATVNFGGENLVSAGSADMFIAQFSEGFAEPTITSINDIGNDQGRKVNIRFGRSGADVVNAEHPVSRYVAFRRNDPPPSATAVAREPAGLSQPELLADGWTQVGSVDAFAEPYYHIDAPTIGDSTVALGQYYSTFYIRAATDLPSRFFDSPSAMGYSLDNLAPGVPQNLVYSTGNLSWDESSAADFDYFTVYGANADNFGTATLVNYSVAPSKNVSGSPYTYYFVTATDFSGNEGKPAKVFTLSGVGETPRGYVLSVSNYPNPFNPQTTVKYTVPSKGRVTITVYDASGARVATLFDGDRSAGAYSVEWDGRTADAAVAASGVYFARIEHTSGTRTKKMVLLK